MDEKIIEIANPEREVANFLAEILGLYETTLYLAIKQLEERQAYSAKISSAEPGTNDPNILDMKEVLAKKSEMLTHAINRIDRISMDYKWIYNLNDPQQPATKMIKRLFEALTEFLSDYNIKQNESEILIKIKKLQSELQSAHHNISAKAS